MEPEGPNAEQIAYWNEGVGQTWARFQPALDLLMEPIGLAALDAAAPRPGERALDVGCGAGATTLRLAERVRPGGRVVGLDISAPLLEVARTRAAAEGVSDVQFLQGDAQALDPAGEPFHLVYSRFGVMFFEDPVAAFVNLRAALRPGGRLAFACWRSPEENIWMSLPLQAAADIVPPAPPSQPDAPGPYAFADPQRVRSILEAAGWRDARIEPLDVLLGGLSIEETAPLMTRVGSLGAALRHAQADKPTIAAAEAAVRRNLERYAGPSGVLLPSGSWIVTARRA